MTVPFRTRVALTLAVAGMAAGLFSLKRHLLPARQAGAAASSLTAAPVSARLECEVDPAKFGAQGAADVLLARFAQLTDGCQGVGDRRAALVEAVGAYFSALYTEDYDARTMLLSAGGGLNLSASEIDRNRTAWLGAAKDAARAPFGVLQMEVRLFTANGIRVAPSGPDEGLAESATTLVVGARPRYDRIRASKALPDIVEVRYPVTCAVLPSKSHQPVLMGYRFAWDTEAHKWILWSTAEYPPSHTGVVGLPL